MVMVQGTWHVSVTWPTRFFHFSTVLCNFLPDWATSKCLACKQVRILQGIQWWWSQARDTCPLRDRQVFFISVQFSVTFDQTELHPSVLHLHRSKFCQEFNDDGPRHMTCVCHMSHVQHLIFHFGTVYVTNVHHLSTGCFPLIRLGLV